jgi:hypothetical protein
MRNERYKGCDVIVMREFEAVPDGHNLLNTLSDDARPVISVEITFPDGTEIKNKLSIDDESSGLMYAYRIIDEMERRKASST